MSSSSKKKKKKRLVPMNANDAKCRRVATAAASKCPERETPFNSSVIGTQVWKLFDGHYYTGRIIGYNVFQNWYRVQYEDDDTEDFTLTELEQHKTVPSTWTQITTPFDTDEQNCMDEIVGMKYVDNEPFVIRRLNTSSYNKRGPTKKEHTMTMKPTVSPDIRTRRGAGQQEQPHHSRRNKASSDTKKDANIMDGSIGTLVTPIATTSGKEGEDFCFDIEFNSDAFFDEESVSGMELREALEIDGELYGLEDGDALNSELDDADGESLGLLGLPEECLLGEVPGEKDGELDVLEFGDVLVAPSVVAATTQSGTKRGSSVYEGKCASTEERYKRPRTDAFISVQAAVRGSIARKKKKGKDIQHIQEIKPQQKNASFVALIHNFLKQKKLF